jgi:hypothetical protein
MDCSEVRPPQDDSIDRKPTTNLSSMHSCLALHMLPAIDCMTQPPDRGLGRRKVPLNRLAHEVSGADIFGRTSQMWTFWLNVPCGFAWLRHIRNSWKVIENNDSSSFLTTPSHKPCPMHQSDSGFALGKALGDEADRIKGCGGPLHPRRKATSPWLAPRKKNRRQSFDSLAIFYDAGTPRN